MQKLVFGKVCSRFYVKWRYHRITICIGQSNLAVNRNIVTLMNFMIITLEQFSKHYVNSVPIRSFPGQCLLAFGLNTERHGVSPCSVRMWEIRISKTPNIDTFVAEKTLVLVIKIGRNKLH